MILSSEKKILVVDHEPHTRDFLSVCLEDAGFIAETAVDYLGALKKIEANAPDLIIFDLAMPKMSGVKLKRQLRKNENWKKIPIIIITTYAKHRVNQKNVRDVLEKSITPSKLIDAVTKALSAETIRDFNAERSDIINMVKLCPPEMLKKIRGILANVPIRN